MTKCQTLRKFWHLELFRWDLLCNLTRNHFLGRTSKKTPCRTICSCCTYSVLTAQHYCMPIVFLVDLRVFEHQKKTFWWRIMSGHPLCKFVLKTMLRAKDDISNLEKHFIVWWVPCAFGTVWSVINHFVKVSFQIYNPVCSSSINLFSWD